MKLPQIPHERLLIYVLLLGLLPLLFVIFPLFEENELVDTLQNNLESIRYNALVKEKRQATNLAIRAHFHDADHFYIDKQLETLVFLEPEIEQLERLHEDKNFSSNEAIKRRLEFLTGHANAMTFSEGIVTSYPLFQETTETLVHPVEVDATDIKKILSRVEGVKIGEFSPSSDRPQLIITEFNLDKKEVADNNEVYLLDMKLLKREFL